MGFPPFTHSDKKAYGDLDPRFLDEINLGDKVGFQGMATEPLKGPHGGVRSIYPTTEASRKKNYNTCFSGNYRPFFLASFLPPSLLPSYFLLN